MNVCVFLTQPFKNYDQILLIYPRNVYNEIY